MVEQGVPAKGSSWRRWVTSPDPVATEPAPPPPTAPPPPPTPAEDVVTEEVDGPAAEQPAPPATEESEPAAPEPAPPERRIGRHASPHDELFDDDDDDDFDDLDAVVDEGALVVEDEPAVAEPPETAEAPAAAEAVEPPPVAESPPAAPPAAPAPVVEPPLVAAPVFPAPVAASPVVPRPAPRADVPPVVALLPTVVGKIDALDDRLRDLGIRVETAAAALGQTTRVIGEHRALDGRELDLLHRELATTEEAVHQVATRLDGIASEILALLDATRSTRDGVLAGVAETVARLELRLATLDERLAAAAALAAEDATMVDVVTRVDERVAGFDARLAAATDDDQVLDALAQLEARVNALDDGLTAKLADPQGYGKAMVEGLTGLHDVVTQLAVVCAAVPTGADLDAVTGALTALDERVGVAAGDLSQQVHASDGPILQALHALERAVAEFATKPRALGAVQRSLAELHSLVEVVVDTMPASADHSADDIGERVAEIVLARLDLDDLARRVAEHLEETLEIVEEP